MEKASKWFAIVNPEAGLGKGVKDWPVIMDCLEQKGVKFEYQFTQWKYHAVELTVWAIRNGFKKILVVGGDGTLNEVVNGVFIQKFITTTDITIGVIGVGTGNDWVRTYSYPKRYSQIIDSIKAGKTILQDVGCVSYFESRVKQNRFFANIAGVGFDARVAQETNNLKESGRNGKVLYMLSLLKSLFLYRTTAISLSVDNNKLTGRFFSLSIGIGKYSGGGMMQVPNAVPDDGLFDVTVIKKINRLNVLLNIYRLYNGTILEHPRVFGLQGTEITLSSKPAVFLEVDGESLGTSPFAFSIIPKSLKIIVGDDYKTVVSPVSKILS